MTVVVDATPPMRGPSIAALLQPCTLADNPMCPLLPPMKCRHCLLLHVTVTALRAVELWVRAVQRHHQRTGPPPPLDGALDFLSLSAVKSANQKSNWERLHKPIHRRCGNIVSRTWFNTTPETWTDYARIFIIVISGVLFPSALILPHFT